MKVRKVITLLIGLFWAQVMLSILPAIAFGRIGAVVVGVVYICLSLAFGILLPNPISVLGLFAGIALLVFPPMYVAITILVLSIAGMLSNLLVWKRYKRKMARLDGEIGKDSQK